MKKISITDGRNNKSQKVRGRSSNPYDTSGRPPTKIGIGQ